ncbi:MAG: hypothetical protein E7442_04025 [Ruminococcaceae bacterium]|nr:hypothetical protein [Oscillospiraceae bacterium]
MVTTPTTPSEVLGFQPNPKQRRFFLSRARYTGYGGARGGGKSWAVRVKALLLALRYPGIRLLLVRRSYGELEDNHIRPLQRLLGDMAVYRESEKSFRFQNGSQLRFGYCDAESDVLRYQGQEYDCIFLDEATQLTEFQFQTFKGCLRGVNDFPKRIYVTCNPGGVGHGWVKRLFIDRRYEGGEKAEDYSFIPADVYDNESLMSSDPDYVRRLESLPYELRQAWLHGSWDVFAGQFFPEWERGIHVCEPFEIPEGWRWYVSMDYGMDMLAAYLIAVDEEGRAHVTAEVYEGRDLGEGHTGLIISEAAEALKALAGERKIYEWLAPPDMWNGRQETGRSVAEIFAEHGIYLTRSSNDRLAGWMAVRERLKVERDVDGRRRAGLCIFSTCPNLIRTLPLLRYDERRPSDCARTPHELTHAPDALRGFCVHWVQRGEAPQAPARTEKLCDRIARQQRQRKRR